MSVLPQDTPEPLHDDFARASSIDEIFDHEPWLRQLALQVVSDPNTAEDLLQETWIAAMRRPPTKSPRAWLRRVFYNRVRSHWRSETIRVDCEVWASRGEVDEVQEQVIARSELQASLRNALMELSEPYRSAMLDYYLRENPSSLIARRAGIPESTVRWRLMRGRQQLRDRLDRETPGGRAAWLSGLIVSIDPSVAHSLRVTARSGLGFTSLVTCALLAVCTIVAIQLFPEAQPTDESPGDTSLPRVAVLDEGLATGSATPDAGTPAAQSDEQRTSEELPIESTLPTMALHTGADKAIKENGGSPGEYLLNVRVVDVATTAPIQGAEVYLIGKDGLELLTHSNTDGEAAAVFNDADFHGAGFKPLEGLASLRVFAPNRPWGYMQSVSRDLIQRIGDSGTLVIPLDSEYSAVRGQVTDESGNPLPGVRVSLGVSDGMPQFSSLPGYYSTLAPLICTTDATGHYEFDGVWLRSVELLAQLDGFLNSTLQLSMTEEWQTEVQLKLRRGHEVSGIVRDSSGNPVGGASVWFDPEEFLTPLSSQGTEGYDHRLLGITKIVLTDELGRFQLTGLPGVELRLWAQSSQDPALVAHALMTPGDLDRASWNPVLLERAPLEVQVVGDLSSSVSPPSLRFSSSKNRFLNWQRLIQIPEDGLVLIHDWPPILINISVSDDLLGSAPLAGRDHLSPEEFPIELVVMPPQHSKLSGIVTDHLGLFSLSATIVITSREDNLMVDARISDDGTFALSVDPATYHTHIEVDGLGIMSLGAIDLHPETDLQLEPRLPAPVWLYPHGSVAVEDKDLKYRIHAHSELGTRWDNKVLIREGMGGLDEPIQVLPGLYTYLLLEGEEIVGGCIIPVMEVSEGHFQVGLNADPVVPIKVLAEGVAAPSGTQLFVISDPEGDPEVLEFGDSERSSDGTWFLQVPPGAFKVEAILPDGSATLQSFEIDGSGSLEALLLTVN
jgi:RNA polymerase sigma factor (sigma-70 family)